MKLAARLLTEMLGVRILPGEPKPFDLNQLQFWVEHPAHDRMLRFAMVIGRAPAGSYEC
jgi:hypothetical protein